MAPAAVRKHLKDARSSRISGKLPGDPTRSQRKERARQDSEQPMEDLLQPFVVQATQFSANRCASTINDHGEG